MDFLFGPKAEFSRQLFASVPESPDDYGGALKRKRAEDDFGLPHTLEPTVEQRKRLKYNEFPSTIYSGSRKLREVRVPDIPIRSASTAVYIPYYEPQAPNVSEGFRVSPSDQESSRFSKNRQLDLRHMWHEPLANYTSDYTDVGSDSTARKIARKFKSDSMTIVDRKHFFIYNPTDGMKAAAKNFFSDIYQLLDTSGSIDDCRLHPTPPQFNGKAAATISFGFNWRDDYGSHRLSVNWGIIALVVRQQLTYAQMDGFINRSWKLSHLCGNWTCCNWRHFTVESGPVNCSRNGCFNSPAKCTHNPPCMKEKKRQLLVTDFIRSNLSLVVTSLGSALSYDNLQTLEAQEIRLMEGFWENSRRGSCAFCGRSDSKAHICSSLSSIADCRVVLKALRLFSKPTREISEAIVNLSKIKEDLERITATKDRTLMQWLAGPRKAESSLGLPSNANSASQQKDRRLWRRYRDLRVKCQKTESTFNDAKLLPEANLSYKNASVAMRNAARDLQMFLRSTKI
ncbi:MAG: hypothetical protein ALECFALPRED_009571 [Alectoria fallacina]|uniref:Zinc-binding loop region of homing endonuclease domain-containing protein n=1 Tax=Alectoria fallacina TaxID=1903189 RepID=A0A8H3PJX8_9LECA|nr:MAG: hypothetical protein ALECFALPRED_009571 [Alectoria fallacina]